MIYASFCWIFWTLPPLLDKIFRSLLVLLVLLLLLEGGELRLVGGHLDSLRHGVLLLLLLHATAAGTATMFRIKKYHSFFTSTKKVKNELIFHNDADYCSVVDPDPESGAFLTPGSGIRDG
jgi:hypothetical protein